MFWKIKKYEVTSLQVSWYCSIVIGLLWSVLSLVIQSLDSIQKWIVTPGVSLLSVIPVLLLYHPFHLGNLPILMPQSQTSGLCSFLSLKSWCDFLSLPTQRDTCVSFVSKKELLTRQMLFERQTSTKNQKFIFPMFLLI